MKTMIFYNYYIYLKLLSLKSLIIIKGASRIEFMASNNLGDGKRLFLLGFTYIFTRAKLLTL